MFMKAYMDRMTPDFVNLSIGLRAPQLYEETSALIMKVPQAFLSSFTQYLNKMFDLGKIPKADFDALALTVFSSTFGYAFLNASLAMNYRKVEKDEYIKKQCANVHKGIGTVKIGTALMVVPKKIDCMQASTRIRKEECYLWR